MRIRTIKPEFWKHQRMAELPAETRLLAIGLLNYADDEGYFDAHPALIRGELMPYSEKTGRIPKMLEELSGIGFLSVTSSESGKQIGHITNFLEHQRINRPTASKHSRKPHTSLTESSVSARNSLSYNSAPERNREGKGREKEQGNLLAPKGAEPLANDPQDFTTDTPDGSGEKKKKGAAAEDLAWRPNTGWTGFTDTLMDELASAYPACDIRRQMLAMEQWLKANPAKARKSNWRKFVTNWLVKEQDRGGDLRGKTPFQAFADGFGAKKEAPPLAVEMPPAGYEQAMVALWGADWQESMPGWPQMVASDKAQVRRWLEQNDQVSNSHPDINL